MIAPPPIPISPLKAQRLILTGRKVRAWQGRFSKSGTLTVREFIVSRQR